jgi:uncharacterized protein (TIGR00251 family)
MNDNKIQNDNHIPKCFHYSGDTLVLHIRVSPNASKSKIMGFYQDDLKIAVKAPPVDGAANKELIRFLAKYFGVPKSNLNIVRGDTSRSKQISIDGIGSNDLKEKLCGFFDD